MYIHVHSASSHALPTKKLIALHDCIYLCVWVTCLDHVFLYTSALVAAQNGEQFVVRNEEKARKGVPLGVQVVVETLLTSL